MVECSQNLYLVWFAYSEMGTETVVYLFFALVVLFKVYTQGNGHEIHFLHALEAVKRVQI